MSENYVLGGSIVYSSTTRTYKTAMRDNRTKTNRGYLLGDGCVRGERSRRGILTMVTLSTFSGI